MNCYWSKLCWQPHLSTVYNLQNSAAAIVIARSCDILYYYIYLYIAGVRSAVYRSRSTVFIWDLDRCTILYMLHCLGSVMLSLHEPSQGRLPVLYASSHITLNRYEWLSLALIYRRYCQWSGLCNSESEYKRTRWGVLYRPFEAIVQYSIRSCSS